MARCADRGTKRKVLSAPVDALAKKLVDQARVVHV
jgi:hypothetical protein